MSLSISGIIPNFVFISWGLNITALLWINSAILNIKLSQFKNPFDLVLHNSDDSFDKMIDFSKNHIFNSPYLIDETQDVAKNYGAVCTPDFFGFNGNLKLQYRGRIRELKDLKPVTVGESDLFKAMKKIAETQTGPQEQIPSMGCGIKWLNN